MKTNKLSKVVLFLVLISFFIVNIALSSSLWEDNSYSPYVKNNKLSIGDIISVQIIESSTALQQAQTNLSKHSDVDMAVGSSWENVSNMINSTKANNSRHRAGGDIGGGDSYAGKGQTARKSIVKAQISVMVTKDLGMGLYEVKGEHKIRVNEEEEKITIKGYIRNKDISPENTIFSYQIANAEVSIEGKGSVSSKQNPGIMTRLFGWLF